MLKIILESGHFDSKGLIHGSPLTIAQQNDCFLSVEIMNGSETKFDYQTVDGQGLSMVGHLFEKLQWFVGDINQY